MSSLFLPGTSPIRHSAAPGRELLLARDLGKSFEIKRGLAHTISQHILRFRREPAYRHLVFHEANFTVLGGQCVTILGGNGSGKSTFLRCLAGVMTPTEGEVLRLGRTVALLTHGFGAYEEIPVWRNIMLVQQLVGIPAQEAKRNLEKVAEIAGLSDRLLSVTSQLSEGMRAKLSLASLMVAEFDVALLDESLNHVDAEFRARFHEFTRKWIREGRSLVLTSHDDSVVETFATSSYRIENKTLIPVRVNG